MDEHWCRFTGKGIKPPKGAVFKRRGTERFGKLDAQTWQKLLLKTTGFDVNKCPYCKKGQMKIISLIPARGHPF